MQVQENKIVQAGITLGQALALVISYVKWHSILWAIIHGVMGWIYVIYFLIRQY